MGCSKRAFKPTTSEPLSSKVAHRKPDHVAHLVASGASSAAQQQSGTQYNFFGSSDIRFALAPSLYTPEPEYPIVGRSVELSLLTSPSSSPKAVLGPRGVGKSALAAEWAANFEGRARWIRTDNDDTLVSSLRWLSVELGCSEFELQHGNPADLVYQKVADSGAPWLLIFDGLNDVHLLGRQPGIVRKLLPDNLSVVVTSMDSRTELWPDWLEAQVLSGLDPSDAADLLMMVSSSDPNETSSEDASRLVSALEFLPGAILQAGKHVRGARTFGDGAKHGTIASYLDSIAGFGKGAQVMSEASWKASLAMLKEQGLGEAELVIEVLSLCADSDIFTEIVRSAASSLAGVDPGHEFDEAVRGLSAFGLVERTDDMIRIAPAVRAGYTSIDTRSAEIRSVLADSLADYLDPLNPDNPRTWLTWSSLEPHIHGLSLQPHFLEENVVARTLIASSARKRYMAGDYHGARELYSRLRKHSQAGRPDFLAAIFAANCVREQFGASESAQEYVTIQAEMERRRVKPSSEAYLYLQLANGRAMREGGRYKRALSKFVRSHRSAVRKHGRDSDIALLLELNLASCLRRLSLGKHARHRYDRVLHAWSRKYGADDLTTLDIRYEIAENELALGENVAVNQFMEIASRLEMLFGSSHPNTLIVRIGELRARSQLGDQVAAGELAASISEDVYRVFGGNHPVAKRFAEFDLEL